MSLTQGKELSHSWLSLASQMSLVILMCGVSFLGKYSASKNEQRTAAVYVNIGLQALLRAQGTLSVHSQEHLRYMYAE